MDKKEIIKDILIKHSIDDFDIEAKVLLTNIETIAIEIEQTNKELIKKAYIDGISEGIERAFTDGYKEINPEEYLQSIETEQAKEFVKGDKITLNTGYRCDTGTFIKYENDCVIWEGTLGGKYKSSIKEYNIELINQ